MATNIRNPIKQLPKKRQDAIGARAEILIREEMNLQELRKAQQLTQHELAEKLGVKQAEISRFESRDDILLSGLNSWVEAMGGKLEIAAKIHGQKIILAPFGSKLSAGAKALTAASEKSTTKSVRLRKTKASAHRLTRNK